MLQANNSRNVSQLPWLGSVPVLGALFRSSAYQKTETDLVIIVTPAFVQPAAPGARLATPFDNTVPSNDVDFFLLGQTEQRKKYNDYVATGGDVQGPYGYMLGVMQGPDAYRCAKMRQLMRPLALMIGLFGVQSYRMSAVPRFSIIRLRNMSSAASPSTRAPAMRMTPMRQFIPSIHGRLTWAIRAFPEMDERPSAAVERMYHTQSVRAAPRRPAGGTGMAAVLHLIEGGL